MSIGYGASVGLEKVLERLFLEQQAKQRIAESDRQAQMQQQRIDEERTHNQFMRDQASRPEPVKPMEVNGRLVNPQTGEVVYESPATPEKPQRLTINGRVVEIGPDGSARELYAAPDKVEPNKPLVLSEGQSAFDPETGKRLFNVPKTYAPKDATATTGQPSAYTVERATRTIDSINKILPRISWSTAGAGASLAGLPVIGGMTEAGAVKAQL